MHLPQIKFRQIKSLFPIVVAAAFSLATAAGQTQDTSGNGMLKGSYRFRHLAVQLVDANFNPTTPAGQILANELIIKQAGVLPANNMLNFLPNTTEVFEPLNELEAVVRRWKARIADRACDTERGDSGRSPERRNAR